MNIYIQTISITTMPGLYNAWVEGLAVPLLHTPGMNQPVMNEMERAASVLHVVGGVSHQG